jgi:DnaJ family protein C protein 17
MQLKLVRLNILSSLSLRVIVKDKKVQGHLQQLVPIDHHSFFRLRLNMADELPPDLDLYTFLNLEPTATESDIRKTYRKLSLRWHPDKSKDPADHEKFHYLKLAVDLLQSPTARVAYDNVRRAKAAKAQRTAKYDDERRQMQRDLENREREAKRRKFYVGQAADKEERDLQLALDKLKEESERLVRERKKKLEDKLAGEEVVVDEVEGERTIKVRFRKGVDRTVNMVEEIFSQYGEIENIILGKSALVVFTTISAAKAAVAQVMKNGQPSVETTVKDVKMAQTSNRNSTGKTEVTDEPGKRSPTPPVFTQTPPVAPKFGFKPTATGIGADYESITLLRMRNLEKAKLEREIREEEEKETARELE